MHYSKIHAGLEATQTTPGGENAQEEVWTRETGAHETHTNDGEQHDKDDEDGHEHVHEHEHEEKAKRKSQRHAC